MERIQNGLRNWKNAWNNQKIAEVISESDEEFSPLPGMWKRVGFIKNAYEYWLLCCILVDRCPSNESEEPHPILRKYDETDMSQVNDLIAEFGDMVIDQ